MVVFDNLKFEFIAEPCLTEKDLDQIAYNFFLLYKESFSNKKDIKKLERLKTLHKREVNPWR